MNQPHSARIDRLIAVDLDGTLIGPENTISEENVAAIQQATRCGAVVVIVTGRPYVSADAVARRLQLPAIPLVSFNGALIRWTNCGETLYSQRLEADVADAVVRECVEQQLHLHYYLDDHLYVSEHNERARRYCERNGMTCREESDMTKFSGQQPLKLLVIDQPERIKQMLEQCRARWGERVYVTRSMDHYLEFLSPQVSKGHALDWLLEFYQLPRDRSLAIGDSMNDLPLLSHAGQPVAMPDADADLKRLARFIPTDTETGVAQAIRWFLEQD
jgi:Cof subfamily protein (haloacid dehalogenase superfamily)